MRHAALVVWLLWLWLWLLRAATEGIRSVGGWAMVCYMYV
jgi:hypothetical protein